MKLCWWQSDRYIHTYTHQQLKMWFSDAGDFKTHKFIKISISKIWLQKQYFRYHKLAREIWKNANSYFYKIKRQILKHFMSFKRISKQKNEYEFPPYIFHTFHVLVKKSAVPCDVTGSQILCLFREYRFFDTSLTLTMSVVVTICKQGTALL